MICTKSFWNEIEHHSKFMKNIFCDIYSSFLFDFDEIDVISSLHCILRDRLSRILILSCCSNDFPSLKNEKMFSHHLKELPVNLFDFSNANSRIIVRKNFLDFKNREKDFSIDLKGSMSSQ